MNITETKILYAVLNWGIGHATRSIPLIKSLLNKGKKVIIASSGNALIVLKSEFPKATFVELPDYKIQYHSSFFWINALRNYGNVNRAVRLENRKIAAILLDSDFDLIISDNAYGCFNPNVKSVLITHQVEPFLPIKNSFIRKTIVKWFKNRYLNPFDEIWVPDFEGQKNLSGALSHGVKISKPIHFIGPQSRFESSSKNTFSFDYDVLVILSGPEPARSQFENLILRLFENAPFRAALVRGLLSLKQIDSETVDIFGLLDATSLLDLINRSKLIICRSGYSSLMDMYALQKRALIVPTPGQTEQEYLAEYHNNSEFFTSILEKDLNLDIIIEQISQQGL